jgi:glycerol-3-phosphate acyltransferase PlsY
MVEIALLVAGYLLGSVPTGYIVGSMAGVDVRTAGSGNVGATNVARVLGKGRGALTLVVDVAKGWLPVFVAQRLELGLPTAVLAGTAAFFGHLYPVFLRFQGGKGVATAFGVFLGLAPALAPILIVIFGVVFAVTRVVSLGSMTAALAAPIVFWVMNYPPLASAMMSLVTAMIIWRHRANIQRLLAGTEPKFGGSNSQ